MNQKRKNEFLEPALSLIIAILIALPNIFWQYQHNWPVVYHIELLQESQLENVEYTGFLFMPLLMDINVTFIWISELIIFLFMKQGKVFRTLGFVFFTLIILLFLLWKPYYALGLYPMLFADGSIAFQTWFHKRGKAIPYIVLPMMILLLMPMLPMSLPVLSHKKMVEYGKWATIYGMKEALRWEDGNYYSLPQDYADMNGWEETIENVADLNHTLDENKKSKTLLYASNYGQAGAIQLYHKKYNLPQPACFNGSFVFWLAYTIFVDRAIMVEDRPQDDSGFFKEISLITQVENPYARDKGYIYFGTDTIDGFAEKRKKSYI